MKQTIKLFLAILGLAHLTISTAQTEPKIELKKALEIDYGYKLPFSPNKPTEKTVSGFRMVNIYEDTYAVKRIFDSHGKKTDQAECAIMYASFNIKGTPMWLCLLQTEWGPNVCTEVLILADSEGRVYDELYCHVTGECITTKDYEIDKNTNITVYSIIPIGEQSTSLWEEGSFYGYRQDCVYKVQGNKFVLVSTKRGPDRLIKSSDFEKEGQYYLWEPFWAI